MVYEKSAAIQGYTNSSRTTDRQIADMDSRITQLKAELKTNADLVVAQKRDINQFQINSEGLTNVITEYKGAVTNLQSKAERGLRRNPKAEPSPEGAGGPTGRICQKI
jgi:hypothetical protein